VDVIAHALELTAARSVHDQRLVVPREQVASKYCRGGNRVNDTATVCIAEDNHRAC
jgi:hypothetical protein